MELRFSRRLLLNALFIVLAVCAVTGGQAHASGESIVHFEARLLLTADNQVEVTETIRYDFGPNSRRGIFREIPTRYRLDNDEGFEVDFELLSVSRLDAVDEQYQLSEKGGIQTIRIGDPNVYLQGQKTYEIVYTLRPIAMWTGSEDIFRFDIVGDGWEVPINSISAVLETDIPTLSVTCYTGLFGEDTGECTATDAGGISRFVSTAVLGSGEGMTVEATFAAGSFTAYPELKPWADFPDGSLSGRMLALIIGGIILILLSLLGGAFGSYFRYLHRRRQELVIPQYQPPAGLTPAEVGLLNDNISNTVEFTATIIDLAIKGYIRIERIEKKGLFGKDDYKLHALKSFDDALDYEKELLEALFDGQKTAKLSNTKAQEMQKTIKSMHDNLVARLESAGYYRERVSWLKNHPKSAGTIVVIALALFLISLWLLVLVVLLPSIIASWMGGGWLYSRVTRKGFSGWAHIEGFKDFLSLTEKERLAFHEAPDRDPEQFSKFLPYAVALGVEKEWAKQFSSIDLSQTQNWHTGSARSSIGSGVLAAQLSSGLNSYARSNFSSATSSGRGGGFSGGGGGGGGGGSW